MRDSDVDDGQGDQAVDDQTQDHGDGVHSKLATYFSNVCHLQNLSTNQEEDSHRGIPVGGGRIKNSGVSGAEVLIYVLKLIDMKDNSLKPLVLTRLLC